MAENSKSTALSLDSLPYLIEEKGKEYAKAKQIAERLDELKKILLAELQNSLELEFSKLDGKTPSETKLERLAKGSEEYKTHVEKMVVARRVSSEKYMEYEAHKNLFDAKRSEAALERAKISIL